MQQLHNNTNAKGGELTYSGNVTSPDLLVRELRNEARLAHSAVSAQQ